LSKPCARDKYTNALCNKGNIYIKTGHDTLITIGHVYLNDMKVSRLRPHSVYGNANIIRSIGLCTAKLL